MLNLATLSGTATNAWIEKWGSAGKTSTAQTGEQTGTGKEKLMFGLLALPLLTTRNSLLLS